jgi:prepilin-type N-terminal cleavage/methylation domain-containing protein
MKKNNNKGFTFIELIIYMGILSIFMTAVVTLMASTIKSYKKMNARKQLQSMASESYDTLSDMLMSATDVRIYGTAYVATTTSGTTTYTKRTGFFVVPKDDETKDSTGALVRPGGVANRTETCLYTGSGVVSLADNVCYDIADVKAIDDVEHPSTDDEAMIDVEYIYIKYASGIDASGGTIYSYCTLKYDDAKDKIFVCRPQTDDSLYSTYASYDASDSAVFFDTKPNGSTDEAADSVYCKNVANFQMQVNASTGTFAIILELEDNTASSTYNLNGVVSLRNSFVLKKHDWS